MKKFAGLSLFVLLMPLVFSACFSRLYSQDIFLFFTAPTIDDEGYFDHLNVWFGDHTYSPVPAPNCRVPENWRGIGSAVLWSPGYLFFKYSESFLKPVLRMQAMPEDQWLRLGAATANFLIASAILWLVIAILEPYIGLWAALPLSAVLLFGGLLPYYLFRRPLMSHAAEAFYYLLAIWGIERIKRGVKHRGAWALIGFACAGVLSTRLQDLPLIALLLCIFSWECRCQWRSLVVLFVAFSIAMLPQLAINHLNLGHWLTSPSRVISFLTPQFLMQLGQVQVVRLLRLFVGGDWGLFLMFPWLLFAFCLSRKTCRELWPFSKAWLLAPIPSLLMHANWIGHGGSYAHRYVSLFVLSLGLVAACGFKSLAEKIPRARAARYLGLAAAFFISLTQFVAFESDESRLSLKFDVYSIEGPARAEWGTSFEDYVNGRYSLNVYGLFAHPKELIRCFGAAPVPLGAEIVGAHVLHRELNPAVRQYLDKHRINLSSYARYAAMVMLLNLLLLALLISGRRAFGQAETTYLPD